MYNNGFWARQYTSADNPAYTSDFWVPFMSGFGGITVVHMPNCTTFWRVSDNSGHAWAPVVAASNAISPMADGACGAPAGTVDPPVDPPVDPHTDPPGDGDNGGNNNGGNGNQDGTEVQLPVGEQRTYVADTGAEGQAPAIGIGVLLLVAGALIFVRRQREL